MRHSSRSRTTGARTNVPLNPFVMTYARTLPSSEASTKSKASAGDLLSGKPNSQESVNACRPTLWKRTELSAPIV